MRDNLETLYGAIDEAYRAGLETSPETGLHDERPPLPAFTGSMHDLVPRDVELSR